MSRWSEIERKPPANLYISNGGAGFSAPPLLIYGVCFFAFACREQHIICYRLYKSKKQIIRTHLLRRIGSDYLFSGGSWWIRTTEALRSRFTVCPHWPLGKAPISCAPLWCSIIITDLFAKCKPFLQIFLIKIRLFSAIRFQRRQISGS